MKQFIIEQEPDSNGLLTLSGKAFVYLIKVRRMREGDILSAVLPQSGAADMVIDSINTAKKTLRLKRQTAPLDASGTFSEGCTSGTDNEILNRWGNRKLFPCDGCQCDHSNTSSFSYRTCCRTYLAAMGAQRL